MNATVQPAFQGTLLVRDVPVSVKLMLPGHPNADYMREPILCAAKDGTLLEVLDGEVGWLLGLTKSEVEALSIESSGPGTGEHPEHARHYGAAGWIRYSVSPADVKPFFHNYSTMGGSEGYMINRTDRTSAVRTYQLGVRNAFRRWIIECGNIS